MEYRIREISTEKSSGLLYVLVDFYDGGRDPVLTNDFLMAVRDESERFIEDSNGWRSVNGVFEFPYEEVDGEWVEKDRKWDRETFKVDVPAIIKANIEAYWERASARKLTGDHTGDASKPLLRDGKPVVQRASVVFERDQSDLRGVLARDDVQALKNARISREAVLR